MIVTDRESAPAPSRSVGRTPRGPLALYMLVVTVLGLPLTAWAVGDAVAVGTTMPLLVIGLMVVGLVVGELLPISISRDGRSSDEITISTTFALALLLVAPLGLVIAAQALPLVLDDLRRHKHWSRPLFNVAQYALAFGAARGAYCLLTGHGFLRARGLHPRGPVARLRGGHRLLRRQPRQRRHRRRAVVARTGRAAPAGRRALPGLHQRAAHLPVAAGARRRRVLAGAGPGAAPAHRGGAAQRAARGRARARVAARRADRAAQPHDARHRDHAGAGGRRAHRAVRGHRAGRPGPLQGDQRHARPPRRRPARARRRSAAARRAAPRRRRRPARRRRVRRPGGGPGRPARGRGGGGSGCCPP